MSEVSPLKLRSLETVSVKIKLATKGTFIIICAYYKPPNVKLLWSDLDLIHRSGNFLLIGDINCEHPAWNSKTRNSDGILLNKYCIQNLLYVVNPEEPTHYPTNVNHYPSVLDIGLTRHCQLGESVRALPKLSSNHNPVLFIIKDKPEMNKFNTYVYSKANWEIVPR